MTVYWPGDFWPRLVSFRISDLMFVHELLARGYFPKELPPVFNTQSFSGFVFIDSFELYDRKEPSRPAVHNLAKQGNRRRKLQIPNPFHYYQLGTLLCDNWQELQTHFEKSSNQCESTCFQCIS